MQNGRLITLAALVTLAALTLASPAHAHRHQPTRLFSHPAQQHPKMPPPPHTPDYQCVPTSNPAFMACCVWDESQLGGMGGWDCDVVPSPDPADTHAAVSRRPSQPKGGVR